MKITKKGTDYISINEKNIKDENLINIPRVHLIKLDFNEPDKYKVDSIMTLWNKTNRYVISNNIKTYNSILKNTTKKYYVENQHFTNIISFFRKNNKVLLNICNLNNHDRNFILDKNVLSDVLRNIEVIQIYKDDFESFSYIFEPWNGNVIIE